MAGTVTFCWVSSDPGGAIIPYSNETCLRLEAAYNLWMHNSGAAEVSVLVDGDDGVLLVQVLFDRDGHMQVTTNGGHRTVQRLEGEEAAGIALTCQRVVWASLDPVGGQIVPYPTAVAQRVEDAYAAGRTSVDIQLTTPVGPLAAKVVLDSAPSGEGRFKQQTRTGLRSVLRSLLDDGTELQVWRRQLGNNQGIDSRRFRLCGQEAEGAECVTLPVHDANSVLLGSVAGFPSLATQGDDAVQQLGIPPDKLRAYRDRLTSEGVRIAARALYESVNAAENLGAPIIVHMDAIISAWRLDGGVSEDGALGPPCAQGDLPEGAVAAPDDGRVGLDVRAGSLLRAHAAAAIQAVLQP